jgi:hypothetical protein
MPREASDAKSYTCTPIIGTPHPIAITEDDPNEKEVSYRPGTFTSFSRALDADIYPHGNSARCRGSVEAVVVAGSVLFDLRNKRGLEKG